VWLLLLLPPLVLGHGRRRNRRVSWLAVLHLLQVLLLQRRPVSLLIPRLMLLCVVVLLPTAVVRAACALTLLVAPWSASK
jgi:hypothetical protein